MVPISIEEFARTTCDNNKDVKYSDLVKALEESLKAKQNGEKCIQCGNPIWAAGSAVTGINMCFTCMTGKEDDSEDYEID